MHLLSVVPLEPAGTNEKGPAMASIDRDTVVSALREEFEELDRLGAGLGEEQWAEPSCLPGWTVKDNLAHVAGTERMLLGEPTPEVAIDHLDHVRNDIARINEAWVESTRGSSGAEVLGQFREAVASRLEALDSMSQADFDEVSWTPAGQDTYGRFMRIRFFDCHLHEQDMREAIGLPLREDGAHLQLALDEAATGLGFIAGKRAGLPAGTGLRVELSDPERAFDIEVAERARLVDALPGDPDVVVSMPSALFLRLIGGRLPGGGARSEGVRIEGDTALGERFVEALGFTV